MAVVPKGVRHRSWSPLRSAVLLFRCQVLADRKNGHRNVLPPKEGAGLPSVELVTHLGDLKQNFDYRDLLHIDDCVVRLLLCRGYTRWHSHEKRDELLIVQDGELVLGSEKGPALVRPGAMVLLPAGLTHRLVSQRSVMLCFAKADLSPEEQMGQEFFSWTE